MYENVNFPGWEVVRKIGEGSFGGVYEIHRTLPDGRVEKAALKKLTVPKDNSEIRELYSQSFSKENITAHYKDQMRELVNEYTLTQELNGCRNVVFCHDVQCVQHADGIGWDIYIRMELLKPLKHVLSADYRELTVLKLGLSLCNALLACQEHHIVHRDIKPENILVSDRGEFKLGDFGIAKVSEKTATGTMTGTMGYMAPEVANRWHYGAQADIYSLGMVLYWMMNRRTLPFLPFPPTIPTAAQRQEAANRRFAGESFPPPVNGSRELKAIVMKACAFSTEERYQTVRELSRDLYACYQQRRAGKTADVSIPADTDEADLTNEPTLGNTYSGNKSFHNNSQNEKTGTLNTDTAKTGTGRFTAPPGKKKSHKWVWIPVCVLLLCCCAVGIMIGAKAVYISGYQKAQQLMDDGEYPAAAEAFDALDGYDDSADKAQEARHLQEMAQDYQAAQQLMDDGEYLAAAEAFDALDGYDDSADKAQEARHLQEMAQDYQAAQQLMDDGKYMQAMWAFSALDFRDSAEKAQEAKSKYISNQPALAGGIDHTVGLCNDGTVVATGENDEGQCNVGNWTDIVAVAAGYYHTVGLRSDGTVVATGRNNDGQCDVDSWTDIAAVAAGYYHIVGLRSDGTVVATGWNDDGQCDVDSWSDIVAVAAGLGHTVGLRSDGTVVATGWNGDGQRDVDSWTDIVAVAAGWGHTVGLRSNGTVVATGWNGEGQCNVGSWTDIVAVAAGACHTVGLRSDGTVVAAGRNALGQCDVSDWKDIRLPQ